MSEPRTHHGGCHCGKVRYSVELDLDAAPAISCNCSICGRSGTLLLFTTPDKFHLEQGEGELSDYLFNKHVIHHLFCKTCGIKSFARGKGAKGEAIAINVRCLDDVDVEKVKTKAFDGRAM